MRPEGMIHQTHPGLDPATRRYGCRVMSLLAIPQLYVQRPLTLEQVREIISAGRHIPEVIGENSRAGKDEHWLINAAFARLGRPDLRGRQIGALRGGSVVFWNVRQPYHYRIQRWVTAGPDGHWCLFDAEGTELYDPWDPEEAVGVTGLVDRYRITKRGIDKVLLYRVWSTPVSDS